MKTARLLAILLALALPACPAWGMMDFNGSTHKATSGTAEVTAAPLSICARVFPQSDTANSGILTIGNSGSATDYFFVRLSGATAGDPAEACTRSTADGNECVVTTTGFTTGVYHSVCAVFASATSRAVYIDGGSKATGTTSITPAGLNQTGVGLLFRDTDANFFDGHIGEVGIWNVALTDDEVASLAKGLAPPCVRPSALVAYYPIVRDTTSLKDHAGEPNNLTLTAGTSVTDHPPVTNCQ